MAFAQRHRRPTPPAKAQHQLEQQMLERRAADRDAQLVAVGEVVGCFAYQQVLLRKEHLIVRSSKRPPLPDSLLQSAQLTFAAPGAGGSTPPTAWSPPECSANLPPRATLLRPRIPRRMDLAARAAGVRFMPLRQVRPVLPFARAPHAHSGCRLLRFAFHPSSSQNPDLRVLSHGASPPGSTSLPRRPTTGRSNCRQLMVVDHASRSSAKLAAYAGLVPTTYSSKRPTFRGQHMRHSNTWPHWVLVEAAWAVRLDPYFPTHFAHRRAHKPTQRAIIATVRRLLEVAPHLPKENRS